MIREPNLAEGKLKFSLAGWPRYPSDNFDESPHLLIDLKATVPRTLKGTAKESKDLSKLLFTPLQLQAPAVTLGMVQQRASPSGWTVWWGTVKVWPGTLCPNSITGEGFRMPEGRPTSHSPPATVGAGSVQRLPLSNKLSDDNYYCQKCLLELQFHLVYCQGPEGPGPHVSPARDINSCPSITAAGLVSSSPQPCPAWPWAPPRRAHLLAGGPSWPQPIPASAHPQGSA